MDTRAGNNVAMGLGGAIHFLIIGAAVLVAIGTPLVGLCWLDMRRQNRAHDEIRKFYRVHPRVAP